MKIKAVFFLLAVGLLAAAAWLVHLINTSHGPFAQGAGREPAQSLEIPEKYRDTVQKGLEYLVKHQCKDGHWEGDDGQHPVAMTGLVGLALLMEKANTKRRAKLLKDPGEAPYAASIRRAADWLLDKAQAGRDGLIFSGHASETARYMQGHGFATLFLAGACRYEEDGTRRQKLNEVLTRAVKYIVKAQSSQGGWYHTSKAEGHDFASISATVIQIQALQAAENAGIPVPVETINDAQEYLKMALGKYEVAKGPQNRDRLAETAAVLACHSWRRPRGADHELRMKWFKICQAEIPVGRHIKFGRDELTHFYYAQAVYNDSPNIERGADSDKNDPWSGYRTAMFDQLQSRQNKDGSWPAGDGVSVGPVYATALWCAVLQLDKRSYPSMQVVEEIIK